MGDMTVAMLLTVASAAVVVSIMVEVIIGALAWDSAIQGRFAPLLAVILGMIVCTIAAAVTGADLAQGVLTGILAGATAMGLHGVVTAATGKAMGAWK